MNRIERRVRNFINPYSTAFAMWWCHSGRYLGIGRMMTGTKDRPRLGLSELSELRARRDALRATRPVARSSMAARRAAIDGILSADQIDPGEYTRRD